MHMRVHQLICGELSTSNGGLLHCLRAVDMDWWQWSFAYMNNDFQLLEDNCIYSKTIWYDYPIATYLFPKKLPDYM